MSNYLPETGFLRLRNIIGDPKATPPIPALIPISKTQWYAGIKAGKFPKPTHAFGQATAAWRAEDIRKLIEESAPKAEAA